MAIKYFLATCNSKKTKHRNGEVSFEFPVKATTQKDAKEEVYLLLKDADEQGNLDYFQVPKLSPITEDEYDRLVLESMSVEDIEQEQDLQDDQQWPELNSSGFYPKDTDGLMSSSLEKGDNVAQVAILQTAPKVWVFGYRYVTQSSSIAKPTNHAQGEFESLEQAIVESTSVISNIAEFQSQHAEGEDQEFATQVLGYDFGEDICSQIPDEPTEDQMHIDEQISNDATLPNQADIDVATFTISETKRIELAVMQKDEAWVASYQFIDTVNDDNNKGDIRAFLPDEKNTRANAITLAMGHAGNWLFQVDEVKAAKEFFKGNTTENFDNGISYAIVLDQDKPKEPLVSQETMDKIKEVGKVFEDKEDDHFIPTNEYELFVYNSLKSIDDAHLDLSPEQYEEAGEKLGAVLKEHETYNAGTYGYTDDHKFNKEKTLSNILEVDWDNSHEAIKVHLNLRSLRALFRENSEFDEPKETPSFQDWSKANKGKSFDDYAEEFNIDSTVPTESNVEYPELLEAITKRLQGEDCPVTPEQLHNALCTNITEQTDVESLSEEVLTINNASILWHSTTSVNLIQNHTKHPEQPSYDKVETKPKKEAALFDKENEWQLYAHQLLSINGEDEKATNQQYVMISGNIQSVFWATGNKLKEGEYYTETASHFMDLIRGVADVTPILMDARKVRELVSDIIGKPEETESAPVEVPTEITSQESANDPINEVKTIADLPEHYQTNPNLALFMKGFETDLAFTKQDHNGRLSIKTQYRIMRATEIWGPIGVGWGYEVKREWSVKGAPIIRNGEITEHHEQVHKCEIIFWYMHEGKRIEFTQYGDTRKLYMSQYGKFIHDDEVEKKSLSDALGKAMSMTGICADIYLGTYDDSNVMDKAEQMNLANKKVKALEFDGQAAETALTKAKSYTEKFETAPSLAEIKRLEKLAIAALEAMPKSDDESRNKKEKCIERVKQQALEAINTFTQDLQAHKEKA
ncbi:conserved hypothetical protein [Vibrio chagasii]|nr:conserved hypothetical protein [Vibrio chagasii]CAH7443832.1 conserved hypothetical protein [Vibrio chagasii]